MSILRHRFTHAPLCRVEGPALFGLPGWPWLTRGRAGARMLMVVLVGGSGLSTTAVAHGAKDAAAIG